MSRFNDRWKRLKWHLGKSDEITVSIKCLRRLLLHFSNAAAEDARRISRMAPLKEIEAPGIYGEIEVKAKGET